MDYCRTEKALVGCDMVSSPNLQGTVIDAGIMILILRVVT